MNKPVDMPALTRGLKSKAAKIRALASYGVATADIARFLHIRYQHAYNVLQRHKTPAKASDTIEVEVSAGGRIVIPAPLRSQLGISEGDQLLIRVKDGELRLTSKDAALERVRAIIRRHIPPGRRLSDELIADRRREAAREAKG